MTALEVETVPLTEEEEIFQLVSLYMGRYGPLFICSAQR